MHKRILPASVSVQEGEQAQKLRLDSGINILCGQNANFFERLDEAVDLQPITEALNATGRQVFIAVPHYYNMKQMEEMPYDIHTL